MEQHVARTGKLLAAPPHALESLPQLVEARGDLRTARPLRQRLLAKAEEETLAEVLDRRHPIGLARDLRPRHVGILAVDVGGDGLETRKTDQGPHLAQSVEEHDALDRRQATPRGTVERQSAGEEIAPGHVVGELRLAR